MEHLHLEGTPKHPTIDFNADTGMLEIKGRSWPEHATNVYQPVFDWLAGYFKNPKDETVVKVSLEYFNTSSSKVILDIFKQLEEYIGQGHNVKCEWYYENDDYDLLEQGEIFQEITKVPLELIGIEEFGFTFVP
ncbi:MAG: nuclear pore complex subunit [Flavobacteriales bacterium]|nr:MAG: nuclear pore complex subunit [Flavobacteriales bacterium]